MMEAALAYKRMGFSIIPLVPGLKIPPEKFKVIPYRTQFATEEEIISWWTQEPNYNIGIVTGKLSNRFVVDIDSEGAWKFIEPYLPENCETPTVKTPRGGKHLYFLNVEELTIGSNVATDNLDIRGETGYAVMPPSVNGDGGTYEWIIPPTIEPLFLPDALRQKFIDSIKEKILKDKETDSSIYRDVTNEQGDVTTVTNVTSVTTLNFTKGHRTDSLFTVSWALAKGGMSYPNVSKCIDILVKHIGYEKPVGKHIDSAFQRLARKERNIASEVYEWVLVTSGYFSVTMLYAELHLLQKEEKTAARVALLRLVKTGKVVRQPGKHGWYRRVENVRTVMDLEHAPETEFPIVFPLGVSEMCKIYPGNIVVVAGAKDAGKTAFMLNLVRLNLGKYPIDYLNSEAGPTELRLRLQGFGKDTEEAWRKYWEPIEVSEHWVDYITDEKKLFLIDYMEPSTKELFTVGDDIKEIHKKLKEGVCVIALQKPQDRDLATGGRFSAEKARLYLALDRDFDQNCNYIKIVSAKTWRDSSNNPRGKIKRYNLVEKGTKYVGEGGWLDK